MGETDSLLEGDTGLHETEHRSARCSAAVSLHQAVPGVYLTGVGVGPFTRLTGEGDCWRPPVTLETKDGGDLEVGFGGTRGGVL